jgi:hypothetical protein
MIASVGKATATAQGIRDQHRMRFFDHELIADDHALLSHFGGIPRLGGNCGEADQHQRPDGLHDELLRGEPAKTHADAGWARRRGQFCSALI